MKLFKKQNIINCNNRKFIILMDKYMKKPICKNNKKK